MNRFVVADCHFFAENPEIAPQNRREGLTTRRLGRTVRIAFASDRPATPHQISISDLGMGICAIADTFALRVLSS